MKSMYLKLFALCAAAVCVAVSGYAATAPKTPETGTTAVYGKDVARRNVTVRAADGAIGGSYASPTKAYEMIAAAAVPEGGDTLSVWVRYRNMALQMKTRPQGATKLTEFPWNWTRNAKDFGWRKVGTFKRSELGPEVFFMGETKFDENSGIDAIVITDDANWNPRGEAPVAAAAPTNLTTDAPDAANAVARSPGQQTQEVTTPGEATVFVDFDEVRGEVDPRIFSLNTIRANKVDVLSNPRWRESMSYMAPKLLRLHNAGLVRGWYNAEKDDWDYDKILEALIAGTPPEGTERMMNINSWPAEYDTDQDRRLDPDKVERFAKLCADLVRFVNIEQKQNVRYWEVTNEKDFAYWRKPAPGNEPDVKALADLYNAAAIAMREVDPTIIIGGPAACNPLPAEPLVEFARLTEPQLDFISFHNYASGNADDSDQRIYDKALVMAEDNADIINRLKTVMPHRFAGGEGFAGRTMEVHLNEYNICYNWRIRDVRMTNHKGAVFDALAMVYFAQVPGMSAANAWNDYDSVYGKVDNQGLLRPAAHVFHYFNNLLEGSYVNAVSTEPRAVVPFATKDGSKQAIVLINRTAAPQSVTLSLTGAAAKGWEHAVINEAGHYAARPVSVSAVQELEPHSVSIYWNRQ